MPSTVEVDVDPEGKQGILPPTTEEGSKEGTPMDLVPEAVKQSKKLESSSSKKQVKGAGAEKTSNHHTDAADTDGTSTSPKKNAGVQIALSQRKQKEATNDVKTVGEGSEKIPCPNTDALPTLLVTDTHGTSILPKSSLVIKEELMQKKGLLVKKAIDPLVPRKKVSLMIPNPQQTKESQARPNFANQAQSQVKLMV